MTKFCNRLSHKLKIFIKSAASLSIAFYVFSCQNTEKSSELKTPPQDLKRIVSLTPAITKQLLLLNQKDKIVGHTTYCPSENLYNSRVVASAMDVYTEKVALLKPDIVLSSTLIKSKTIQKLKSMGLYVYTFNDARSYDDILRIFKKIGKLTKTEKTADKIISHSQRQVNHLMKIVENHKKNQTEPLKMMIQIGADPIFAATDDSFMHDFIRFSGGINICAGLKQGMISRETVLIKNPDIIFIVTMGLAGENEQKTWENYKSLSAAKKGNVFILDADTSCATTPKDFAKALKHIVFKIYPNSAG